MSEATKDRLTEEKVKAFFDQIGDRVEAVVGDKVDAATTKAVTEALNEQGKSIEQFRAEALERIKTLEEEVAAYKARANMVPGLEGDKDAKKFSFQKVCRALVNRTWKGAEMERDICAQAQKNAPEEVIKGTGLSIDAVGTGGALVPEELLTDIIELQRANMVLVEAGARVMSGLTRNPTRLPRLAGGATYYWVGTGATARTITASKASFERISLTQHKVAAATYIDYEMLMDANPGVEQIVREDFGLQLALAWDEAGLIGDSSSSTYQPDGVVTVAGTNSVAIGANGGAMTYNKMQDMVTALDEDNALRGSPKWIFHPRLRGELSKIVDGNSRPIFVDTFGQAGIMPAEGGTKQLLLNYPYLTTTTLPVNLTKGGGTDLTYLLLADWSQMLIGYWGGLAIMATNEGQTLALEDQTLIVAKRLGDIGFRHLAAFCVCSDALSTS